MWLTYVLICCGFPPNSVSLQAFTSLLPDIQVITNTVHQESTTTILREPQRRLLNTNGTDFTYQCAPHVLGASGSPAGALPGRVECL